MIKKPIVFEVDAVHSLKRIVSSEMKQYLACIEAFELEPEQNLKETISNLAKSQQSNRIQKK